jgi:hypothetical protein
MMDELPYEIVDWNLSFDLMRAERDALRAEVAELSIDLSKPPQQRAYCAGCSLPFDLAAAVEVLRLYREAIGSLPMGLIGRKDMCDAFRSPYAAAETLLARMEVRP